MVIPPQFDEAVKFSEGLAAVFIECRWGYIDKTGALVIKPQFKFASEFSEGLAAVDPYPSNEGPCPPAKSHDKLAYINPVPILLCEQAPEDLPVWSKFHFKNDGLRHKPCHKKKTAPRKVPLS